MRPNSLALFIFTTLASLGFFQSFAQTLSGIVQDSLSGAPMAFVNVSIPEGRGTLTDLDGRFELPHVPAGTRLRFGFVGYKTQFVNAPKNRAELLVIRLVADELKLDEVVIDGSYNPAHRLVEALIENRKKHDPLRQKAFSYRSYNKFRLTPKMHTHEAQQKFEAEAPMEHFMLLETVTERRYAGAGKDEEKVLANRVSGFQNPQFAMVATELQPFGFYQETFLFLERDFVSPLAPGATRRYLFDLQDSLITPEGDTLFIIPFEPQRGKNFQGLVGTLYLSSNGYALREVSASPADSLSFSFEIQQKYRNTAGQWFPEQLHIDLTLRNYPSPMMDMHLRGRTYLKEVALGEKALRPKTGNVNLQIAQEAHLAPDSLWQEYRQGPLELGEQKTYWVMDSIGKRLKLDQVTQLLGGLASDKLDLGAVYLKPSELFLKGNGYEGIRLGLDLETTPKVFGPFSVGGYAAWGFRDQAFKWGVRGQLSFPGKRFEGMRLQYRRDVHEPADIRSTFEENKFLQSRWFVSQMDSLEQWDAQVDLRPHPHWRVRLGAVQETRNPTYTYQWRKSQDAQVDSSFGRQALRVGLRYSPKERTANSFGQVQVVSFDEAPIFQLDIERAFGDGTANALQHWRVRGNFIGRAFLRGLGENTLRIEAGWAAGDLPMPYLFSPLALGTTGIGSIYQARTFMTMQPYEFLGNQYAHVFWTHNFKSLLFGKGYKWFAPEPELAFHAGWGQLTESTQEHSGFEVKDYREVFTEAGLNLHNLVKIRYQNLYYLGFGVGAFYRFGAYKLPETTDNLALQLLLKVSL